MSVTLKMEVAEPHEPRNTREMDLFARMQTSDEEPLNLDVLSADLNMIYQSIAKPYQLLGPPPRDQKSDAAAKTFKTLAKKLMKEKKYEEASGRRLDSTDGIHFC